LRRDYASFQGQRIPGISREGNQRVVAFGAGRSGISGLRRLGRSKPASYRCRAFSTRKTAACFCASASSTAETGVGAQVPVGPRCIRDLAPPVGHLLAVRIPDDPTMANPAAGQIGAHQLRRRDLRNSPDHHGLRCLTQAVRSRRRTELARWPICCGLCSTAGASPTGVRPEKQCSGGGALSSDLDECAATLSVDRLGTLAARAAGRTRPDAWCVSVKLLRDGHGTSRPQIGSDKAPLAPRGARYSENTISNGRASPENLTTANLRAL